MNVNREVIVDLLPLYVAGEASPSSRALVEEFLETDPELRAQVQRGDLSVQLDAPALEPGGDVEVRALRRTRGLLAWQRRLYGLGLATTILPLSSVFWWESGQIHHRFLLEGIPGLISGSLSLAFWCWLFYWIIRRKLRTTAF